VEENMSWLQSKVAAQKRALDQLHSRVVNQRFMLNLIQELGHYPSREEFLKARDAVDSEQARERIGEPA
jgi:hypothetical protein